MISYRGPSGGVKFAKPSSEITILDIIHAIDGEALFNECILGLPNCGDEKPCPLHDKWSEYCQSLQDDFSQTSIQDLVLKIKESNLRIVG